MVDLETLIVNEFTEALEYVIISLYIWELRRTNKYIEDPSIIKDKPKI